MKFRIFISFKNGILDPEAEAIKKTLKNLNYKGVKKISRGKFFDIEVNDKDKKSIEKKILEICENILANPVIEDFSIKKVK